LDGPAQEAIWVTFGAAQQNTDVLSNASHGFTGWFSSQMSFGAGATSQLLSFVSIGATVDATPLTLLDNVVLTAGDPPVNDVPEPASLALFALGPVAVAATRRSRHNPPTTLAG
jgi:hypothetical protein